MNHPASHGPLRLQDQVLHMIFGADSGRMVADFSCAYEKRFLKQGRLYVSTRYLCFYSNLFGFEEKLRIPYAEIVAVRREKTALIIDNAIYVTTADAEYQFRSFWDRDSTIAIVERCWQLNRLGGLRVLCLPGPAMGRKRSESHPEALDRLSSPAAKGPVPRVRSVEYLDLHVSAASLRSLDVEESLQSKRAKLLAGQRQRGCTSLNSELTSSSTATESELGSSLDGSSETASLRRSFEAAAAAAVLRVEVVREEMVDLSLGEFFASFLADRAPLGLDRYQLLMKESEVEVEEWRREGDDGRHGRLRGLAMRRRSRFRKPVNTFGIESTLATKNALLTIFPDCGIVLTAITKLDESSPVPGANCFDVLDSMVVREIDNFSIAISLFFEVRFSQRTMLQYFIEFESNRNTLQYLNGYILFIKENRVGRLSSERPLTLLLGSKRMETVDSSDANDAAKRILQTEVTVAASPYSVPTAIWSVLILLGMYFGSFLFRTSVSKS